MGEVLQNREHHLAEIEKQRKLRKNKKKKQGKRKK